MEDPRDETPDASPPMPRRLLVSLAIAFELLLLALAVVLGWLFDTPALARLRFEGSAVAWGLATSLALLAGLLATERSPWPPLVRLRELLDEVMQQMFAECKTIDLIVISILAGVCEEAFFRGFLQTALGPWTGIPAAVLIASALFGAAHWVSRTYFVTATLIGVLFGWQLVHFDNLLVPIIGHAVYDFLALSYLLARHRRRTIT